MANAPAWGFDLDPLTRAVASVGLPNDGAFPPGPLDDDAWAGLRSATSQHRLSGLLVAAVATGQLPATDEQRAELAAREIDLTLARMWHQGRAAEIVDLLEGAGIEVRVLKGPALATLDYPDAQWRPTQDIDLLVHGTDIDQASDLLVQHGGRRLDPDPVPGFVATVGKGATVAMPDGLEVDLHRLLVWGPLGVRLPVEELWNTSRTFEWGSRQFETLGVEETLLHACSHLLVLGWRRALTLRDVAQVLSNPTLDPDRVLHLAKRWDCEALLATGVLLAERELNLLKSGHERADRANDDVFGDRAVVSEWAHGFAPRWRDTLWLRVERPGDPVGALEAVATYLELGTSEERRTLRNATFRPLPGTYPAATERVLRVTRRSFGKLRKGILGRPNSTV